MTRFNILLLTSIFLLLGYSSNGQNVSLKDFNWKTDSLGLKYHIHKTGNDNRPNSNSEVKISCVTILDGNTKADTSVFSKINKTEILLLSSMVNGFIRSVCMLGEGGEGLFCVPPKLAYENIKDNEYQNQTFYFFIKLIEIIDSKNEGDISTQITLNNSQFNSLLFDKTTVTGAKTIIGKPTTEKKTWSNANLGFMCVHSYLTIFTYESIGTELLFYSLEKDKKDNKVLSCIVFDSTSNVKINDSIQLNNSDTLAVKKIFGNVGDGCALDNDKKELNWYYKLKFVGQDVNARFVFNDKGILQRLEITKNK